VTTDYGRPAEAHSMGLCPPQAGVAPALWAGAVKRPAFPLLVFSPAVARLRRATAGEKKMGLEPREAGAKGPGACAASRRQGGWKPPQAGDGRCRVGAVHPPDLGKELQDGACRARTLQLRHDNQPPVPELRPPAKRVTPSPGFPRFRMQEGRHSLTGCRPVFHLLRPGRLALPCLQLGIIAGWYLRGVHPCASGC